MLVYTVYNGLSLIYLLGHGIHNYDHFYVNIIQYINVYCV